MTSQRPAGTVYGRGGVDVRGSDRGLHPAVLGLVVVAAIVAVLALGYWAFLRGPADAPAPAAQAAVQSAPAPPPTAPPSSARPSSARPSSARPSAAATSPSPSAAATFGTGRVLLSSLVDRDTYLVADGDFAAMSSDDTMVLTVGKGLADSTCFTVRDENGRYLRHFAFRLRFDKLDDSDLFRADATFCPVGGQPAGTVRLRSKNYPDRLVHRRGSRLYIDKPSGSGVSEAGSSFAVRRG